MLRKLMSRLTGRDGGSGMLPVGATAPDFTARAHDGRAVRLSDLRGRKVILWFYPKADTPG